MNTLPYIGYSWYEMYFIFCFWSVTGWLLEAVDMTLETGHFQNRGFLHIPFCPIYGFGMLLVTVLLQNVSDTFFPLFFASMSICTILEYFVGWLLETLFHARWWDYSHMKFNIKGRVCLRNALMFGFGCILVMRVVEPFVEDRIHGMPVSTGKIVIIITGIIIAADTCFSLIKACRIKLRRSELFQILRRNRPDEDISEIESIPEDEPVLLFLSHK